MEMFARIGLYIYLTQTEFVASLLGRSGMNSLGFKNVNQFR